MTDKQMVIQEVKGAGSFLGHGAALIAGLFLLIIAMAMGVTMVLLPPGFAVGLAGFLLIVWGLGTSSQTKHTGTGSTSDKG